MMPKHFDLSAIAKELPDYAEEGDPPGSDVHAERYVLAMLEDLDRKHEGLTDVEHVVGCFNDALAGILHGLSQRVAKGQMLAVVDHLTQHASYTMRWVARNEDEYGAHSWDKY
jgi:hypothetical protein